MTKQPKYRRPLNTNQLHTLQLLFKFRYVTAPLLSELTQKSRRNTQKTLQTLEEQNYISKRYDTSYRLQGKQASYFLTRKGLDELSVRYSLSDAALKPMRRNSSVSQGFMDHHLMILKAYTNLTRSYKDIFNIFTRYELDRFSYFIRPLPNLYLSRKKKSDNKPNDYVLDIYTDRPSFVMRNRLDAYLKHFDHKDWQKTTKTPYPVVLIACPNQKAETALQAYSNKKNYALAVLTTTVKALENADNQAIWTNTSDVDKLMNLENVFVEGI